MLKFIKTTRTIIVGFILVFVFFWAIFATPTSDATYSDIAESDRSTASEIITEHKTQPKDDTHPVNDTYPKPEGSHVEPSEAEPLNPPESFDISKIPAYTGNASYIINDNVPYFTDEELTTDTFENYSDLDSLGRCGVAFADISTDTMPTQEREKIGEVRPSGWHTVKYNGIIDGNYLYNRCHLIAYQLAGENANIGNLITGTRYMNTEGMLPYENLVADYLKQTGNHVLYRATPVFEGDNLVAHGVLLEALSVEDSGAGVMFNIYCYNVQPGIEIDYATGESRLDGSVVPAEEQTSQENRPEPVVETTASAPEPTPFSTSSDAFASGTFAVNSKNGKIHKVGECPATGTDDNAMTAPVYFNTYDKALAYSQSVAPNQEKRDCGNCW